MFLFLHPCYVSDFAILRYVPTPIIQSLTERPSHYRQPHRNRDSRVARDPGQLPRGSKSEPSRRLHPSWCLRH